MPWSSSFFIQCERHCVKGVKKFRASFSLQSVELRISIDFWNLLCNRDLVRSDITLLGDNEQHIRRWVSVAERSVSFTSIITAKLCSFIHR